MFWNHHFTYKRTLSKEKVKKALQVGRIKVKMESRKPSGKGGLSTVKEGRTRVFLSDVGMMWRGVEKKKEGNLYGCVRKGIGSFF